MDGDTGAAIAGAAQSGIGTAALASNPWTIGLAAGASLVGGLMSAKARKEEERKRRQAELQQQAFATQAQAAQAMTTGQQNAFSQLMQGYQSALR